MTTQHHPFHIVFSSPWPLLTGMSSFSLLVSSAYMMNTKSLKLMILSSLCTMVCVFQWWRDISREASFLGFHTNLVINGLRLGMLLFILSEVMFFFSFFWTFFHSSLSPNYEINILWPPLGMQAVNPFQIPILNTAVLISSGFTVTAAHHLMIQNKNKKSLFFMITTILLGVYFTSLQAWEYAECSFSFSDSVFGSTFFLATGFHGVHVLVGTLFLYSEFCRQNLNMMSQTHHFGMEAAIWYWHFVDVVWLFLYSFLYWWSF